MAGGCKNPDHSWSRTAARASVKVVQAWHTRGQPEPESFQTNTNFYNTPDQIEQAVNGAYTQMRGLFGSGQYRNLVERRGPTLTKDFDVNLPNTVSGSPQTDEWTMTVDNDQ
ncbi:MAG: hypothetical protein BRC49_01305, partial [Cyanobacteria bacterium SW_10_48_33]